MKNPALTHRVILATAFALIAICLGGFFASFEPPISTYDSREHYFRTWMVAHGHIRAITFGPNRLGDQISERDKVFVNWCWRVITGESIGYSRQELLDEVATVEAINANAQATVEFSNTTVQSPLNYVPQVVGMWVGKALGLDVLGTYRTSCWANLLAYVLLVMACILMLPRFAMLFACFSLMPLILVQASTQSTDGLNHAVPMLFLAFMWRLREGGKPVNQRHIAVMMVFSIVLCLLKQSAIVFLPGLLLARRQQFTTWKHWIGALAACVAAGLAACLAWNLPYIHVDTAAWFNIPSNPPAQMNVFLHTPWAFALAAFHFLADHVYQIWPLSYLHFQHKLLPDTNSWWPVATAAALILAWLLAIAEHKKRDVTGSLLLLAIAIANVLLVLFIFWIGYTPVGFQNVLYVQGRYMTVILFLSMVAISSLATTWLQRFPRWTSMQPPLTAVLTGVLMGLNAACFVSMVLGLTVRLY